MASIYQLKSKFQDLLLPILKLLYRWGISANQITIASILLSAGIGVAFWNADLYPLLFLSLPIGLFLRMALNALDGMMARRYNQQSRLGEVLNEVGDVISDVFIFIPLLKFESQVLYFIVAFITLSIINEFAGVLGKAMTGTRRYNGPMGKSDRAFLIGVYGILSYFAIELTELSPIIFSVINVLIVIGTCIRLNKSITPQ